MLITDRIHNLLLIWKISFIIGNVFSSVSLFHYKFLIHSLQLCSKKTLEIIFLSCYENCLYVIIVHLLIYPDFFSFYTNNTFCIQLLDLITILVTILYIYDDEC